ncbi:hypothetical protein AXF42_Ash016407 [Apostasia shenzhenica]|uniref:Pectin acetylesterase n=1 Tax=Apostasia shenzhenica TaxID=1088818 RepID=A0A2I0A020_9ASPA|nr:hypothetical protein AXF42_Ash016407 [Apostasia shenzhenica]
MKAFGILGFFWLVSVGWVCSLDKGYAAPSDSPLIVDLTLVKSAGSEGALCLDGSLPGYHLDLGYGSGANNWVVHLEGGAWCNDTKTCVARKKTALGSSKYMKPIPFVGIMSNRPEENPDFYNWNRVYVRYCDGASFSGEGFHFSPFEVLYFRGERIWYATMGDLMSKGMKDATQALLSGCSAGGLASILHCDRFRALFPASTKVKCFADAGFFLDVADIAGHRYLREIYNGVVDLQGLQKTLPLECLYRMDATSCFFPQNLVANVETPLFILNAAYDDWQIPESLVNPQADPNGLWMGCILDYKTCSSAQIEVFQDFRLQMLAHLKEFSKSHKNGLFINSCFIHCQSEFNNTWFGPDSPSIGNKSIAESVGDWYFDRAVVQKIDCPYPCDNTCVNHIFKKLSWASSLLKLSGGDDFQQYVRVKEGEI